ncbi:RNA metabolism protein [Lithospermum erythrorhizon]|uniref:YTH domain-containing family protein n=1 Tax=Lithospermum erythrorhizon TaxID=34254 RepID=A0AAV3RMV7_LITER
MEETNQQQQSFDQLSSLSPPGDRAAVELHNLTDQPVPPKDEKVVSAKTDADAAITGAPMNSKDQIATSETSGSLPSTYPYNTYTTQEQSFYYGGYDNISGNWDQQTNYASANNLHVVPPAMYNDNSSLFFPPGHGYDAQMGYGQYSPIPSPISPIVIDGQLFSPHQFPMSPSYYPQAISPGLPHVSSGLPASQTELMAPGNNGQELADNMHYGLGSSFYVPFGSFGGDLSGNSGFGFYNYQSEFGSGEHLINQSTSLDSGKYPSTMTPGNIYSPHMGMFGSYEQNITQASFQGPGLGSSSSMRRGSFNYPGGSSSRWESNQRNRVAPERGGRRERDRDYVGIPTDLLGSSGDRNRGPRAVKPKSKGLNDESASSVIQKDVKSLPGLQLDQYNNPDFGTDYENAKFFVIKSFSEDNIHKSIKYNVWASTPLGNKKLDAAYRDAKEKENCPVFLFFSVNASGQFCGVAEMVGSVDFERDADYWQHDSRWSGQFQVKWHIIKDVPNSRFRHILLENNENKPVTHSRDSQEVKLEQGIEMLRIFKNHDAETSLLDDFTFYDEREKVQLERKAKQRASLTTNDVSSADPINQLSDNLAETLNLNGNESGGAKDRIVI